MKFHTLNVIILGWVADLSIASGILAGRSSNTSLHFSYNQASYGQRYANVMGDHSIKEVIIFLHEVSPPHHFYLLYDNTTQETDAVLRYYAEIGADATTMELKANLGLIFDILFKRTSEATTSRRHILLLCSLANTIHLFKTISSKNLEHRSVWWILLLFAKEEANTIQDFIREGSQVLVLRKTSLDTYKVSALMTGVTSISRFQDVTEWSTKYKNDENLLKSTVFTNPDGLYSNFNGRQLTATANNNHPFILMEKDDNNELKLVAGFEYAIIDALGSALNFTYRMVKPADGKWGGPLPDGTVVGMIGVVSRREAHFAMCEITITGLREEVIDFSYPYYIESLTMVSRTPREKNRAFAAFSPFTPMSWLSIAVSTLIVGCIVSILSLMSSGYQTHKQHLYNLNNSLFNVFRCLLKQQNMIPCAFWPLKCLLIFWYIVCLIISALYSGMLIATLIKPSFEKPINGLTDLPNAIGEGFTLVVTADTSMEYMFKEATEGLYAQTWTLFNHEDRSKSFVKYSIDSFAEIIDDKLIVMNGLLTSTYHSTKRGINRFYIARETFAPQFYGAALASGSPFLPMFNKMFSYMVEGGLLTKWVKNEFQKVAGKNIIMEDTGPRPFTVNHLQAAFYILPIGFIFGMTALTLEIIYCKCDFPR